jgi:uncharacterized membrane protein (DUF373 family)
MKKIDFNPVIIQWLERSGKIIAVFLALALLVGAGLTTIQTFNSLLQYEVSDALQKGLAALINLEMFYVVRSFIKYGSINVGIVVNVGIIACIKELIFKINSLTMQTGIAFGVVLITLAVIYYVETLHFQKQMDIKAVELA